MQIEQTLLDEVVLKFTCRIELISESAFEGEIDSVDEVLRIIGAQGEIGTDGGQIYVHEREFGLIGTKALHLTVFTDVGRDAALGLEGCQLGVRFAGDSAGTEDIRHVDAISLLTEALAYARGGIWAFGRIGEGVEDFRMGVLKAVDGLV